MNPLVRLWALLGIFFACWFSSPAKGETYELNGTDITPVVTYFQKRIRTTNRPLAMYSWSQVEYDSYFTKAHNAEEDLDYLKSRSQVFWNKFGKKSGNYFGSGLYLAADPVITRNYGGKNWVLLQLKLPAGLKVFDVLNPILGVFLLDESDAKKILASFKCDGDSASYFKNGGDKLAPSCQALLQSVFRDILKVDLLGYYYMQTKFPACPAKTSMEYSFVMLRSDRLSAEQVRYFTQKSGTNNEDRLQIQTLFMDSARDASPLIPNEGGLLWNDLAGKPRDAGTADWVKKNVFGCDGDLPYEKPDDHASLKKAAQGPQEKSGKPAPATVEDDYSREMSAK